eukprot:88385_1
MAQHENIYKYHPSHSSGIYGSYGSNIIMCKKITGHRATANSLRQSLDATIPKRHQDYKLMMQLLYSTIQSLEESLQKSTHDMESSENKESVELNRKAYDILIGQMQQCQILKRRFSVYSDKLNHFSEQIYELHTRVEQQYRTYVDILFGTGRMYNVHRDTALRQRFFHLDVAIGRMKEMWHKRENELASETRTLHDATIKIMDKTDDIFRLAKQIYKERGSPVFVDRSNSLQDIKQNSQNYKNVALPIQLGQDKPFDCWNEQAFKQEFSQKFNIPIECIEILSIKAGSTVIDLKLKTHSNGNKLLLPIECLAENISTVRAKKELVEFGIFGMEFSEPVAGFAYHKQRVIMNPQWNREYGANHTYWKGALDDGKSRGGEPYYCPKGWKRFAVQFDQNAYDFTNVYDNWPIAYHGTPFDNHLLITLTSLKATRGEHGEGVYLSPSIKYVSHPRYCKPFKLDLSKSRQVQWSKEHINEFKKYDGKYIQCAFACRVKPGSFIKRKETMSYWTEFPSRNGKFDNININKIEWIVKEKAGKYVGDDKILIYGYMIKASDTEPTGYKNVNNQNAQNDGCIIC